MPSDIQISIHALREEGDPQTQPSRAWASRISIHALREEGDDHRRKVQARPNDFNPRPPRGGRPRSSVIALQSARFQSTPSARRATLAATVKDGDGGYFNPRPPRGGRLDDVKISMVADYISIHALREEGDCPYPPITQ